MCAKSHELEPGTLDAYRTAMNADPHALPLLRFAALFLWADLEVAGAEHAFLHALARELGLHETTTVAELLAAPPHPDDVDPTRVPPELARTVRDVALRAIASDGRVDPGEMALFDLLDELLPDGPGHHPS